MKCELADICYYYKEKIDVSLLNDKNYISTENMLPNKAGITISSSLPTSKTTQKYEKDDILVSNIRPYFKKIWKASFSGGCSNDVLVFRAKENISSSFLYYVLSNDKFFEYSMSTAKGTKMPRGDKEAIMHYEVPVFTIEEQEKIASILSALDDKIVLNQQISNNLLEQLNQLFAEFSTRCKWNYLSIGEIAEKVAMGPFGSNIKVSTFVESGVPIISGNHLRGYFLEEPSYNYITEAHAEKLKNSIVYPKDIIFTHAGNIGQVAMIPDGCEYPFYVISQRQFYLRCNTSVVAPEYVLLFFHSRNGQYELLSYANQTGVPSIAQPASNLKKICLPIPPISEQEKWFSVVKPIIAMYQNYSQQIKRLSILRDTLLPRLMSDELDVSDIEF